MRGSRFFVSPRIAGLIAVIGIWLYTILVGADTAVVRAAIMMALLIIALMFLGRPTFLFASLFAAALCMTIVNPLLMWDVGSQLSFMAVFGLMFYVGPWSNRISGALEPTRWKFACDLSRCGPGEAVFIESPGGRQIVVDGGDIPAYFWINWG